MPKMETGQLIAEIVDDPRKVLTINDGELVDVALFVADYMRVQGHMIVHGLLTEFARRFAEHSAKTTTSAHKLQERREK